MKKISKYTVLTVVLAVVFSLGSVEGMNLILRLREHQLLYKNREIVAEDIGSDWQERESISVDMIEDVVRSWHDGIGMAVHAPVKGQVSMQDAVKAAKTWLTQMDLEGYDWGEDADSQIGSVYATLGTLGDPEEVRTQPYYSFWKVQLSSRSMEAILYVNAVTAGIWRSEVRIYENLPESMPYWKLRDFLEFNKLEPYYGGAVYNEEGTRAVWEEGNSWLCARMGFVQREGSGYRKTLADFDEELIGEVGIQRKSVFMIMKLAVREEARGNEQP